MNEKNRIILLCDNGRILPATAGFCPQRQDFARNDRILPATTGFCPQRQFEIDFFTRW